ncbi:MAG: hypothetical protein GQ538_11830 [Xanthomonadales bacterium]|nr:hypothetical protein [Xanthomonadales bacterium]
MRIRLALVAAFSTLLLSACAEELSVEQHVIANLRAMEEAAEQGEHFDFMDYVSELFAGQYASMDRRAFHRFMIFQLNQKRRLHAQFFPIHVLEISAGQATAQFNLLVTGGTGLLPESGQLFDVKTRWQLEGNDWLLTEADWEVARLPE